jgi:hypothetical protein
LAYCVRPFPSINFETFFWLTAFDDVDDFIVKNTVPGDRSDSFPEEVVSQVGKNDLFDFPLADLF